MCPGRTGIDLDERFGTVFEHIRRASLRFHNQYLSCGEIGLREQLLSTKRPALTSSTASDPLDRLRLGQLPEVIACELGN